MTREDFLEAGYKEFRGKLVFFQKSFKDLNGRILYFVEATGIPVTDEKGNTVAQWNFRVQGRTSEGRWVEVSLLQWYTLTELRTRPALDMITAAEKYLGNAWKALEIMPEEEEI